MRFAPVELTNRDYSDFENIVEGKLYDSVIKLAAKLEGKRILNLNSTMLGGGVAQVLGSIVPLMRDLGIDAHWQAIEGADNRFFEITKKLHNTLQGDKQALTKAEWSYYEEVNVQLAKSIEPADWDYVYVHDPQPLAVRSVMSQGAPPKWVWRCHIDLSSPNTSALDYVREHLRNYDGAVFTLKQYVPEGIVGTKVGVAPMAIDPLTEKNIALSEPRVEELISAFGVDRTKPLICQVSRFDPWKDPLGVIKAWRLAKKSLPELQLVLMGDAAADDPEGARVLNDVIKTGDKEEGLFILTDCDDQTVRAFQQGADVILQKSLREGFGLTVSEALWAKTPVIGGKVGGIPLQIIDDKNGYLVTNVTQAAERIVELIKNPLKRRRMGQWGHEYVRRNFLSPRLLRDELLFLSKL